MLQGLGIASQDTGWPYPSHAQGGVFPKNHWEKTSINRKVESKLEGVTEIADMYWHLI